MNTREHFTDAGLPEKAFEFLLYEHKEQIKKWGWQMHHLFEWLAYITEEEGELARAISEYVTGGQKSGGRDGDLLDIAIESMQVATLAAKLMWMIVDNVAHNEGVDKEVILERIRQIQEAHRNQRSDG